MTYFRSTMSEEERYEADRLRAEEKREKEPEETEDSALVRYVRGHPLEAAAQISALQEAAGYWAKLMHQSDTPLRRSHYVYFEDCPNPECRKLRDRLRPL